MFYNTKINCLCIRDDFINDVLRNQNEVVNEFQCPRKTVVKTESSLKKFYYKYCGLKESIFLGIRSNIKNLTHLSKKTKRDIIDNLFGFLFIECCLIPAYHYYLNDFNKTAKTKEEVEMEKLLAPPGYISAPIKKDIEAETNKLMLGIASNSLRTAFSDYYDLWKKINGKKTIKCLCLPLLLGPITEIGFQFFLRSKIKNPIIGLALRISSSTLSLIVFNNLKESLKNPQKQAQLISNYELEYLLTNREKLDYVKNALLAANSSENLPVFTGTISDIVGEYISIEWYPEVDLDHLGNLLCIYLPDQTEELLRIQANRNEPINILDSVNIIGQYYSSYW